MVIPVWCRSFRAQAACWAPYSGHRVMSLWCSSKSPAVRGSNGRALLSMCFRAGAADFWQRPRSGVPIAWICMDLLAAKSFGSVVCTSTECSYGYFTAPPQSRVIQSLAVMELDLWNIVCVVLTCRQLATGCAVDFERRPLGPLRGDGGQAAAMRLRMCCVQWHGVKRA